MAPSIQVVHPRAEIAHQRPPKRDVRRHRIVRCPERHLERGQLAAAYRHEHNVVGLVATERIRLSQGCRHAHEPLTLARRRHHPPSRHGGFRNRVLNLVVHASQAARSKAV
uniref:hypothetical protein n=1 Tax=Amycolatopsis sp. CA-290885 TaxID=3239925 RepID=UPI003F4908FE